MCAWEGTNIVQGAKRLFVLSKIIEILLTYIRIRKPFVVEWVCKKRNEMRSDLVRLFIWIENAEKHHDRELIICFGSGTPRLLRKESMTRYGKQIGRERERGMLKNEEQYYVSSSHWTENRNTSLYQIILNVRSNIKDRLRKKIIDLFKKNDE